LTNYRPVLALQSALSRQLLQALWRLQARQRQTLRQSDLWLQLVRLQAR
jgi:hypothetical protein